VHKVTAIATEAGGELWSPDGRDILFTSDVYPECADEACNAKKLDAAEKSKVKAQIFDRLLTATGMHTRKVSEVTSSWCQ